MLKLKNLLVLVSRLSVGNFIQKNKLIIRKKTAINYLKDGIRRRKFNNCPPKERSIEISQKQEVKFVIVSASSNT